MSDRQPRVQPNNVSQMLRGNPEWSPPPFEGAQQIAGNITISSSVTIGGTLAKYDPSTDTCTFDWPAIEAAAKDEAHPSRAWARLLLAARETGQQVTAPTGFE